MAAEPAVLAELAAVLDDATRRAVAVPQLTSAHSFDLADAYRIQAAGVELRLGRGEAVVGAKLGFTSKAKAEQMGVADVIVGVLTSAMSVDDGGTADLATLIHPRIEPEVAFRLARSIEPGGPPLDDPWDAIGAVAPAMEIIDSRYRDFSFSLEDVVADNTSAALFVVGEWRTPEELAAAGVDLGDLAVSLEVDDEVAETGSTADILGHPLHAIAALVRLAGRHGLTIPAGSTILAGAATAAAPLPETAGSVVTATVAGLGRVAVTVTGGSDV
jgi:2-oxo-3-hexenedioate decarboxylase